MAGALVAGALVAGWLAFGSAAARAQSGADAAAPVMLILGDSLSAAYGMPLDQGWVALLQRRLDANGARWRVVNASISGDTTAGGLSRLPGLLAEHRPALVVIELGANDGLRGFTPAQIAADLERLIVLVRESGENNGARQKVDVDAASTPTSAPPSPRVLLLGVPMPPNYGQAYTEGFQRMFSEVAARTGVAVVPGMLDGVADRPDLVQADGLHPLATAQPLILENIWAVLGPMLEATPAPEATAAPATAGGVGSGEAARRPDDERSLP